MAFGFQKASCVVVGTFNMYILHPRWLAKHGIIEQGVEVGIATNFTQPGFRLTLPKNRLTWLIAPNRLAVESPVATVDCGDYVAKVLESLPETPLQAIGNNVEYEGALTEFETLSEAIRGFPKTDSPQPEESVVQRTFHVGVKRDDRVANLQLALSETDIELSCNVHESLQKRGDANRAAVAAAKRFFDDRKWSNSLARHFFGTAIDP